MRQAVCKLLTISCVVALTQIALSGCMGRLRNVDLALT
jgi:hypothetical protein